MLVGVLAGRLEVAKMLATPTKKGTQYSITMRVLLQLPRRQGRLLCQTNRQGHMPDWAEPKNASWDLA